MDTLYCKDAAEWRRWLHTHHDSASEVWLRYYKKESGKTGVDYERSVEEALCYGWVDSLIRKLDDESYARKFTPRKDDSKWSPSNKKRVASLIESGRMTAVGLAKIEAAKRSGLWDKPTRPDISLEMPPAFEQALAQDKTARTNFERLAPSHQKQYIIWIAVAKRPETQARRIRESIELLQKGEKLGMK